MLTQQPLKGRSLARERWGQEEGWRAGWYSAWIISQDLETWLITMVLFSSPKDTPSKSPKWFINGSDPNHLLYNWDDPPSGRKGRHFFQDRNIGGLIGLVLRKVIAEESYFTICKIQQMANWWFGARWFGILGVFLSSMFFFIRGSQESKPPAPNRQFTISWLAPENGWLEYSFSFGMAYFQV